MNGVIGVMLTIVGLFMIAFSLIMPIQIYNIFALNSNQCPKYCDGCCISTKPNNATGLASPISPTGGNHKALMPNNSPTPPACPDKGPIPPDCTMKPKF